MTNENGKFRIKGLSRIMSAIRGVNINFQSDWLTLYEE